MNGKKIISLLCASALSVSSFAGLSMSVAAENIVLYSNSFDSYTKDMPIAVAYSSQAGWGDLADQGREPFASYIKYDVPTSAVIENGEDAEGAITVACGTLNDDDTSGVYIREKEEGNNYVSIPKPRFSKQGITKLHFGAIAEGATEYTYFTANDGEDLVIAYDMMLTQNGTDRLDTAINLTFGDIGTYSYVEADEGVWKKVRIVKQASGTTDIYFGEEKILTGTGDVQTMSVDISAADRANNGKYQLVNVDNMVIMSVAAGTGATVEIPAAKTSGEVVVETPTPAPEKTSAEILKAPSSATVVLNDNFSSYETGTLVSMGKESQDANTTIKGMSLKVGARSGSGDGSGAFVTEWVNGDRVLKLTSGQFSTAGRGIVATLDNDLSDKFAAGETIVMSFQVNLSTNAKNGVGRLYFLKDTTQAGSDGNGAYRNVAAVLTTDDEVFKRGDNDVISAKVTADEWHKVSFVVSGNKFRVYIDDDYDEASIQCEYVATGENATTMSALPMLALASASSSGTATYSTAVIDNLITYSGTADNPKKLLPSTEAAPTPAPEVTTTVDETAKTVTLKSNIDTAVWLIQASYLTDGTFDSIKKLEKCELTANTDKVVTLDSLTMGDKIMVWADEDGKMSAIPLSGSVDVETGDAQKTPEPTVAPTETPAETVKPTETPAETVKPTEKPTETVKPTEAPATYKVNVAEKITGGNVSVDKTTAKEGEEVTVKAEANDGYVFGKITVTADGEKTVEVKDNKFTMPASDVTVSAEFNVKTYTVTGTVDAGVEAVSLVPAEGSEIKGTITDTTVTFEKVAAGTYTVKATAKYGYKKATADKSSVEVTADASSAFAVTTTARTQQAYTAGTATYDEENVAAKFVDYSRTTTSVVASTAGNNTSNVESIKTGSGGNSGAGYNIYTEEYPAEGEAVAVSFDVNIPARNAWVSVRGTKPNSGNRDNNNTNRIFTVGAEGSYNLKIYNGGDTVTVANTDLNNNWYHIDAVVNNKEKTVAIKVYDYQSTNDYEDLTALYEGEVPFRDNTVKGVVAMDYYSNTNNANIWLDNIYVNDPTWTAPKEVNVTAPESTDGAIAVDMKNARAGATVTITSTPVKGKKTSAVKVVKADGTEVAVTKGENDTYTFVMPEKNVTVSAEYARADIATLELSGLSTVSTGSQNTYTVVAKAADDTVITPNEGEIEWRVEGHSPSGSTGIENGVLSVWSGEVAQGSTLELTVKAYVKDNADIKAEMKVTVTAEKTYEITKAEDIVGGSVSTSVSAVAAGDKVVVNVNPDAGYGIKRVFYTKVEEKEDVEVEMLGETDAPEGNSNEVEIVKGSDGSYSFEMPEYPVKISAEFEKVELAITNKTADDANGKITVAEKAKLGDVVEVTVEPGDGYELASLTYKGDSYNSEIEETAITKNTEGKYTFVMPGEAVQVKATFIKAAIVRDVVEGVKVLSTYDTTATRLGDRNVLQAPSGNMDFTSQEVLTNNVTLDTDFLVSDDEVLHITFGRSSSANFSGQTSTLIITGKDGKITMQGQNGDSSYIGLDWTTEPTLESGKWYRMVVSSVMTGNASPNAKLSIYAVDEDTCAIGDKLGEGTLKHRTGSDAEWNRIQWGSTGTPSIDNAYVYTNDKYETTVTVTDGENAVEGAEVKVNDVLNTTVTTNAEGKAKFDLIAGEYTVTVEKAGYDAPEETQTISVGKENTNALTIAMTEKKQTLTTMTIDGGMENHTVLTKAADTVVAKLSVSGKDANGDEMGVMPTVTWSSDSENTTVENGVVTVKSTQGAGTVTITAAAENDVKAEYKIIVAKTGTEVVLLATDDFEGKTSIFEVKNGAAIEEAFTNNNVLKLGGTAADVATAAFATPVIAETGKKIDVSYNTYNGWLSTGKNIIWTLKNSNGEKVLEYTYDTDGCKVTAVTLAGVEQTVTAFGFQDKNGWGGNGKPFTANVLSVNVTLNADKSATVSFIKSGSVVQTYTVSAEDTQLTGADVASFNVNNGAKNSDRSGGFDNFKTTISVVE